MQPTTHSDAAKRALADSAEAIRRFLRDADFDEEVYDRTLRQPLGDAAAALPAETAQKLFAFVRENVEPLVYDTERVFAACRTTGHDEDGAFIVDCSDDFYLAFTAVLDGVERRLELLERELSV